MNMRYHFPIKFRHITTWQTATLSTCDKPVQATLSVKTSVTSYDVSDHAIETSEREGS